MQTIPQATANRNPRSVNDRRSHQTARPGWRPRRRSRRLLAADIAASIQAAAACGEQRTPEQYTANSETRALVRQLLAAAQA